MFDIGWTELLLIGIVALIVVGPKDLPVLFRKAGQFMGRARGMAREFSRAMESAADETGMKDAAKTMRDLANPRKMGMDALNQATEGFRNWQPDSATAKLAEERAAATASARATASGKTGASDLGAVAQPDPAAAAAPPASPSEAKAPSLAVPDIRIAPPVASLQPGPESGPQSGPARGPARDKDSGPDPIVEKTKS